MIIKGIAMAVVSVLLGVATVITLASCAEDTKNTAGN